MTQETEIILSMIVFSFLIGFTTFMDWFTWELELIESGAK